MSLRSAVLGAQLLFLVLLFLIAAFAATGDGEAVPSPETDLVPRGLTLVFPLAGEALLTDSFGDPRPGRRLHKGVDIMAPKMTPVVAAVAGTVTRMQKEVGGDCCALVLRHDGGWTTRYLHLNNDTVGTDDGRGYGIAPGIRVGSRVEAGRVIGWVGDSGNAETTSPHLHFELRDPDRRAVDPYAGLLSAPRPPAAR